MFFFPTGASCAKCGKKFGDAGPYASGPDGTDYAGRDLCGDCYVDVLIEKRNAELKAAREKEAAEKKRPGVVKQRW